jgi:hypothetical protein
MAGSDPGRRRAAFLGAGAVAATGYVTLFRLGATWGATADERRRSLPDDELMADATLLTTHGITIDAPPEAVARSGCGCAVRTAATRQ